MAVNLRKSIKILIVCLSGLLYIFSLTKNCYCETDSCAGSLPVAIFGFVGAFNYGQTYLVWLANPLLWASWVFIFFKPKVSVFLSVLAFLIALAFLLCVDIKDPNTGVYHKIISREAGYWLWLSSIGTMLLGTIMVREKKSENTIP
ncbi:MAG: hypothetical protein IAF38_08875 [Bacteroidia bacterium]|nr:hypothetical protein [Bacteroidia bacterium]